MRTVSDIMRKPRGSLFVTHSLADAAEQIGPDGGGVVVLNLCGRPVGVITDALLQRWRAAYPENWRKKRCACALPDSPAVIPGETLLEEIQTSTFEIHHTLLVSDEEDIIGWVSAAALTKQRQQFAA